MSLEALDFILVVDEDELFFRSECDLVSSELDEERAQKTKLLHQVGRTRRSEDLTCVFCLLPVSPYSVSGTLRYVARHCTKSRDENGFCLCL